MLVQKRCQWSRSGSGKPIRKLLNKILKMLFWIEVVMVEREQDDVFSMYLKSRTSGACWIGW